MDADADMTVTIFFGFIPIRSCTITHTHTHTYMLFMKCEKKESAILHDRVKISTIFRDFQTSSCNDAFEMANLFYDSIIYIYIYKL